MSSKVEREVRTRAGNRCEYCLMPQTASELTFPIDHIIARQHGGSSESDNLALCCGRCNQHKGPNVAGIDPISGQLTRLFNPRIDAWQAHFRMEGAEIVGLTEVGRTTIVVLNMNHSLNRAARQALIDADEWSDR